MESKASRNSLYPATWQHVLGTCLACLTLVVSIPKPQTAQAASAEFFSLAWTSSEAYPTNQAAWGDMDNDGYLDLATADVPHLRIYHNEGGGLPNAATWDYDTGGTIQSLAWGDVNGDGRLDLAAGGSFGLILLINQNGILERSAWQPVEVEYTNSLAWGDVNGDGLPDLAAANGTLDDSQPVRIYRNTGGVLGSTAAWSSSELSLYRSVAWGDVNGDGKLDLAVGGNGQANNVKVYRNDTTTPGSLQLSLLWSPPAADNVMSVAWGDYDNDQQLDLAVGNSQSPAQVYQNTGGALEMTPAWTAPDSDPWGSLAWGDVNSDGTLDLVSSGGPSRLYLNQAGTLASSAGWSSIEIDDTSSVALGDMDNDGDLDLAAANHGHDGQPNRLYRNNGLTMQPSFSWSANPGNTISSLAWGDLENDGDLDLAIGSPREYSDQPAKIYRNHEGVLDSGLPVWISSEEGSVTCVAWGDANNDGYLDLAAADYDGVIRLYLNHTGNLSTTADWSSTEQENPTAVAWGDYNGDGYLDLAAAGGTLSKIRLYQNSPGGLSSQAVWSSAELRRFTSLAWGDVDGDGLIDLAAGSIDGIVLHHNDGGALDTAPAWQSAHGGQTNSLAWGDVDGDGLPDLAAGNFYQQNRLYHNQGGMLAASPAWTSNEIGYTVSTAFGDYDGDGDPDLMTGNLNENRLYRNDRGVLSSNAVWQFPNTHITSSVTWGDVDGDGDLDLAVTSETSAHEPLLYLYPNNRDARWLPGAVPVVSVARPGPQADFYSVGSIHSGVIPIEYKLTSLQSDPVAAVYAWYSPDGGGRWFPAAAAAGTPTTGLTSSPDGSAQVYQWDVNASGFFGQSDQVVLRIQAVPGTITRPNSAAGPFLRGGYTAQSLPFRVRGTQVRVMNGTAPVPNARVYRLPAGQSGAAAMIADRAGQPYLTDSQGYLLGRGEIKPGDRLVALAPVSSTPNSRLYSTSAAPTSAGLDMHTVTSGGIQTLNVSSANPLVLLNLNVSLEWDARQDAQFLEQMHFNFQRSSELLYQWSHGQVALGHISLYHDRQNWDTADIRIYATNNRRPAASMGGIVSADTPDPDRAAIVYQPGMVHIGKIWSRYGDAGASTGEDWPRALAHELGHFALFLDDDYLGLDANGHLISVDTCTGTPMTDPYRNDYSAFKPASTWLPGCADTLAQKTTGRADWATITTFYPALNGASTSPGPGSLPLDVTQVSEFAPPGSPQALPDPRFYLKDESGASLQPGSSARAFLYRDDRLVDLGSPMVDSILAPGARPGDRVCVSDLPAQRSGCKTVQPEDDQQLSLGLHPDWHPEVVISPQGPYSVDVRVGGLEAGLSLSSRLYSGDGRVSNPIPLTRSGSDYTATFSLTQPTADGFVLIWQNTDDQHVVVADYAMGGSPARLRSGFARLRSGFAPAASSDGQVILYTDSLTFPEDEFYTLQAATTMPATPAWTSLVGHAYWLSKSTGAPDLSGASLSMGYPEGQAPAGEETWLKVYHWNQTSASWDALDTRVDPAENNAVAVISTDGLYALMSTIELPLNGPGWELFAYPIQTARPVAQALQSIAGAYTSVYGYDSGTPTNPWRVYAPGVPTWVNDLLELKFGEGYWINLTQAVTLRLRGDASLAGQSAGSPIPPGLPPATFYGLISPSPGFTPTANQPVKAWIDGADCGSGQTLSVNGQIGYSIHVFADGQMSPGCGEPGKTVRLQVGSVYLGISPTWSSDQVWRVDQPGTQQAIFLPLVVR